MLYGGRKGKREFHPAAQCQTRCFRSARLMILKDQQARWNAGVHGEVAFFMHTQFMQRTVSAALGLGLEERSKRLQRGCNDGRAGEA